MTTHQTCDKFDTSDEQIFESEVETKAQEEYFDALYSRPIASTRSGSIFNAHSYPTKINTSAIIPFIVAHTKPGDLVFDGFAGTGSTGLASSLCDDPTSEVQEYVETLLGEVAWGPRDCILYDISELATFTSRILLNPPNYKLFAQAAKEVLEVLDTRWSWIYGALDNKSSLGGIRHVLWTDFSVCPRCNKASTFWELAISISPPKIASIANCPHCHHAFDAASARRLTERYWDDLLNQESERRKRTPAFVYGRSGNSFWKRSVTDADLELIERINNTPIPTTVPIVPMLATKENRWGELYRTGYHFGITHLHHFYTRRNLIAIAAAWKVAEAYPEAIRDALHFWISSYNSSHSTLMTRVVCKENSKDFVVTSAQSATLYISSLPVEKNVFAGLRTKLKPITAAFEVMQNRKSCISVHCSSSLKLNLPESSVDYIFTDPPFGDNIQYSEVNFINEAWLGKKTTSDEEVIISQYQHKSAQEYQKLLTGAFSEAFRILKPGRYMTVIFHSTRPDVWNALREAWENVGFQIIRSSVLDKTQASFKQVTTEGAVRGDPVILLQKPLELNMHEQGPFEIVKDKQNVPDPWKVIGDRLLLLDSIPSIKKAHLDSVERTRQRLYSYIVTYYLQQGLPIPLNANSFFAGLDKHYRRNGEFFYLHDNE